MYIPTDAEILEEQFILNKVQVIKQTYFIKQYDKAKLIVNNRNLSLNERKMKVHQIHRKMMKYFSIVNEKFKDNKVWVGMEDKEVWIVGTTGTIWFRWMEGAPDPGRLDTNRCVGWHWDEGIQGKRWYYTYGDTVWGQRQ